MKLLEAFEVRGLVLKNRIVMPAMCPNFASGDGFSTDRLINYYATRARGGVGLIITENAYVSRDGLHQPNQIGLDNENKLQKLIEVTDAIHAEGGKVFVQLNHGGRNSLASITGYTPVAPSPIRSFRIFPKAEVVAIENDRAIVKVEDHEVLFAAATVVEAIGALPDDELKRSLDAKGISSVVVGDCKLPRDAYHAIHEGFLAALSI